MIRPPGLTDSEWADYLACEVEHREDLVEVAQREAEIEHGIEEQSHDNAPTDLHPRSDQR